MLKDLGFNSLKVQIFQGIGYKCQPAPLHLGGGLEAKGAVSKEGKKGQETRAHTSLPCKSEVKHIFTPLTSVSHAA